MAEMICYPKVADNLLDASRKATPGDPGDPASSEDDKCPIVAEKSPQEQSIGPTSTKIGRAGSHILAVVVPRWRPRSPEAAPNFALNIGRRLPTVGQICPNLAELCTKVPAEFGPDSGPNLFGIFGPDSGPGARGSAHGSDARPPARPLVGSDPCRSRSRLARVLVLDSYSVAIAGALAQGRRELCMHHATTYILCKVSPR